MQCETPALQLLALRRCRTAVHRCPVTQKKRDPKTTGLRAAHGERPCHVVGVGIALQDEHCSQFDERLGLR